LDNNLKEKIESEIVRINKLFESGKPLLALCELEEPNFVEASAAALLLQSFYNGIENIILLIFKNAGEPIPDGAHWHKKLFEKTFESSEERTAIFSKEYKASMAEYLSFRHFIRHSYGFDIDWKRMKPLINGAEELWRVVEKDINQFIKDN
jgi:hypothetical protein